jgi:hypothetical protein
MSNYCIKERKEERKTRGPRGAWKGPYLDPKGSLRGPPAGPLGGHIEILREPHQGP